MSRFTNARLTGLVYMFPTQVSVALIAFTFVLAGCRQNPQQREAGFLHKGKSYVVRGDFNRAILEFRNAVAAMPRDPAPYYQLGLTYLKTNNVREAARMFQKAVSLDENHSGARLKLAELLLIPNNPALAHQAEEHIQKVLSLNPADPDALFFWGVSRMELGKPEEAEKSFDEILKKSPQNLRTALALARLKMASKDPGAAEEVLKQAAKESPGSAHAATVLGAFYVATGRDQLAEARLRSALQLDPRYAPGLVQLAALLARQDRQPEAEAAYKTIASLPDKEYRHLYGLYLLRRGKTGAAIAEFERLSRFNPKERTDRTRLVASYLYSNRTVEAQKVLDAALTGNPKDVDALLQRSEIHLRRGNVAAAKADIEGVLRFEPNSGLGHYLMSAVYSAQGLTSLRRSELVEAIRLAPGLLRARIELANALLEARNAKSALATLDSAPRDQHVSAEFVVARNWILISGEDYGAARRSVTDALAKSKAPELLVQDGVLKLSQKNYAGARSVLEEALKKRPADVRALRLMSESYAAENNRSQATQTLRRHATLYPNSVAAQLLFAASLLEGRQLAEARTILARSKAVDPQSVDLDLMLARVDVEEGKLADAQERLSRAASSNPRNVSALLMLGMVDESMQRLPEAVEEYSKVVSIDNQNVIAWNNLAGLLARDPGRIDEALQCARNAKELAQENAAVCDTLGWIYYLKGFYRQAKTELETALQQEARPGIQYHLGLTCMKTGDLQRGRELVAAAIRANPKLVRNEAKP